MKRLIYSIALLFFATSCSVTKNTNTVHQFTGDSIGCGSFIVYQLSDDNTEFISVALNVGEVELRKNQTYRIGKANVIEVKRKRYSESIASNLCNDVRNNSPRELLSETATSGLVEVLISDENLRLAKEQNSYQVSIVLKNVIFEGVQIDYLKIENINVGWLPG